ncbi:MAG: type I-E CRISPR-associated protein Cse2/CasB [Zoogloeaceae bacterium]|jgi:CRISPR system Cascade subunit CasB|nr:type I-E CRISPR-associated protein Cse2/CasB [Zoogloeaceae bacterium]
MTPRKPILNSKQHDAVRDWWRSLQPIEKNAKPPPDWLLGLGRADRAHLRRCACLDELLSQRAALLLAKMLIARNGDLWVLPDNETTYRRLAWVAGVLAMVKEDLRDGCTLTWHLGRSADADRPVMNEQRFQRLERTRDIDDLFIQWRRAVRLADGKADVAQLADDLLTWQIELDAPSQRPNAVRFHWAYDYYLTTRDQATADKPSTDKESDQ